MKVVAQRLGPPIHSVLLAMGPVPRRRSTEAGPLSIKLEAHSDSNRIESEQSSQRPKHGNKQRVISSAQGDHSPFEGLSWTFWKQASSAHRKGDPLSHEASLQ